MDTPNTTESQIPLDSDFEIIGASSFEDEITGQTSREISERGFDILWDDNWLSGSTSYFTSTTTSSNATSNENISPRPKRRKGESWVDITVRVLHRNEIFRVKWISIVEAMNLKNFGIYTSQSGRNKTPEEFKVLLKQIFHDWENEHYKNACLGNLLGYLHIMNMDQPAEDIRERCNALKQKTLDEDVKSWKMNPLKTRRTVSSFKGREKELFNLHRLITTSTTCSSIVITPHTAISGLGGIGKSELVRNYARCFSHFYEENVFWIDSETQMEIKAAFIKLGQELLNQEVRIENVENEAAIKNIVQEIYKCFKATNSLFIFDNVDSVNSVKPYLPDLDDKGPYDRIPFVIVTSRLTHIWARSDDFHTFHLGPLNEDESLRFLSTELGKTGEKLELLNSLAAEFGGYPLALQQVVAYIKRIQANMIPTSVAITQYLELYKRESQKLLDYKFWEEDEEDLGFVIDSNSNSNKGQEAAYKQTLYTILVIAMNKISNEGLVGQLAMELLYRISYCNPDKIPLQLLLKYNGQILAQDRDQAIRNGIKILQKYSLISPDEHFNYSIHRLVQKVVRLHLVQTQQHLQPLVSLRQMLSPVIAELVNKIPINLNYMDKLYVGHANSVLCDFVLEYEAEQCYLQSISADELLGIVRFVMQEWKLLYDLDLCEDALKLATKCTEFLENKCYPIWVSTNLVSEQILLEMKYKQCLTYLKLQNPNDAIFPIESVYNRLKVMPPGCWSDLDFVMNTTFFYGWTLNRLGRFDHANAIYQECYSNSMDLLGNLHRITLSAKGGLANIERTSGKHDEAVQLYSEIVSCPNHEAILTAVREFDDSDILIRIIYTTYGLALNLKKMYEESYNIRYRNCIRIESKFGPSSTMALGSRIELIESLIDLKRYDEAEQCITNMYQLMEYKLGATSSAFFALREHQARIYLEQGVEEKVEEAVKIHEDILNIKLKSRKMNEFGVSVIHSRFHLCKSLLQESKVDMDLLLQQGKDVYKKQKLLWRGTSHNDVKKTEQLLNEITEKLFFTSIDVEGLITEEAGSSGQRMEGDGRSNRRSRSRTNTSNSSAASGSNGPVQEPSFVCHICDQTIKNKSSLKKHLWEQHRLNKYQRQHPRGERLAQYDCELCDRHYKRRERLMEHYRKYHPR